MKLPRGFTPPAGSREGARAKVPDVRHLALVEFCQRHRLPEPEQEIIFHPERHWRFDWGWREQKLALELEGVTRSGGRHQRVGGFTEDARKYLAAAALGWTVLRVTQRMYDHGEHHAALLVWLGSGQ